ncbi:MATE efflux family protein [Peptoanaerobacter stomatis]|uniref:MATE efflux family protein n=1 Tax=Peptoanaerobacter stomatis TaxID=796937 RepID=V9HV98_9FIRM|nr:MATE family efflux transporter [Peptoanaerobacter stomatis]EHL18559.1 MATE efflux family protein [Peptoanaerobacter stomatis]
MKQFIQKNNDLLLNGPISKGILLFVIPIFIGNLFQQLYNIVDSLIVGNYLGSSSLAAVSSSTALILLMIGFFDGLSIGSGVVIARYYGNKDIEKMQRTIHTCIGFALITGIVLTAVGIYFVPYILVLMDTPTNVLPESITYFRIYFMGSMFFVLYNMSSSILRSVGDSVTPLKFLMIASITNIILDYFLVGIMGYGVGAAAFATITSQFISAFLCINYLMKVNSDYKLHFSKIKIEKFYLKQILKNGIPAGIQGSIISLANVVVQSNVNHFGEYAVAGNGSYEKISGFTFLPITCFSLAISTFISQNLGAGNIERMKKGAKFAIITGVSLAELMGFIVYIFIPHLMTFFSNDARVIFFGVSKARICAGFAFLLAFSHIMSGILRGLGKAYVPMFIMLTFWCVVRVTYLNIVVPIFPSIDTISWAYPITWSLSSLVYLIYYIRIKWDKL